MKLRDPELFAYVALFGAVPLRIVLEQLAQPPEHSKRYDHTHCLICGGLLWADRKHVSLCSKRCRELRAAERGIMRRQLARVAP